VGPRKARRRPWWLQAVRITGIALGCLLAALALAVGALWLWAGDAKTPPDQIKWGVTWSAHAAKDLGLDPEAAYRAMLDELHPQRLRLVAYWTDIEPKPGVYNYHDLDFQVAEAEKHGIPYVIAIGRKVPRYPECFIPDWAQHMTVDSQHQQQLEMMARTVRRYDGGAHMDTWQVENEPYLDFGICPKFDPVFLKQEVATVRSLTSKPLLLTDSGELSTWLGPTQFGDEFGSTLYRVVINPGNKIFHHFLWPDVYTRHGNLIKKLHPNIKKVIVAELQAEPWGNGPGKPQSFYDLTMSHDQLSKNIEFARQVGFPEVYMWGAEWWYYEKLHGDDYYWRTFANISKK
jgi:hypothetical protein